MLSQCAYGRNNKNETCLNKKELMLIATKFNIKVSGNINKIYNNLLNDLNVKDDIEMINKYNKKSKEKIDINNVMKPPTPGFYLSNIDIDRIMKQFANAHSNFMSYGAVPYDFWKRPDGSWKKNCDKIYGFDLIKFINGKKEKWGLICNTSPSSSSGSHWVCMFFEADTKRKKAKLEYFDSIGTEQCRSMVDCTNNNIPTEIMKFINIVKDNCEKNGYDFEFKYNYRQQQKGNNECGMYCIYYILNRIQGVEYDEKHELPDKKMTYLRHVLFRSPHYCWNCKKYKKEIKKDMDKWGV